MEGFFDVIVIGAGASGLAATALLEKKGLKVALLESHRLVGGCSSYFERNNYVFDAGATTLSGFAYNGPLKKFLESINLDLPLKQIDPGIISIINGKKIHRYSDQRKWINELEVHFPQIDHQSIWDKISKINESGWSLVASADFLPISKNRELLNLLNPSLLPYIGLLPLLKSNILNQFKLSEINNPEYLALLNEMLFITAQNDLLKTPAFMGAMGLSYPADTFYCFGGMKHFSNGIATKCSHLYLNTLVTNIEKKDDLFYVKSKELTLASKIVISTLPVWNHEDLFSQKKLKDLFTLDHFRSSKESYSAFMLYFTIDSSVNIPGLYYQIHSDNIPYSDSKSFFVSLSHPEDIMRSHHNRQTVTISIHIKPEEFSIDKEMYNSKKKIIADHIIEKFCSVFAIEPQKIDHLLTGSPKTFQRYTRRYDGLVGGLPHSIEQNPLSMICNFSGLENFYMIGDTRFPGQGIGAVILGAMNLAQKIK